MEGALSGLTHQEAAERLRTHGPNSVVLEKKLPTVLQFLKTFNSPLILLLLASSAIAAYFGDIRSFVTIMLMLLLSAVLDYINVYKSDKAAQKLKDRIKVTATVLRDGEGQVVRISQIVPGDIVVLKVGNIVPADGTAVLAEHCFVNESSLTGESYPVSKRPGEGMYMGSSLVTGEAYMEVTATGKDTRFNHVVSSLSKGQVETEFDREIRTFSVLILKLTAGLLLFVFLVNALLKQNYLESLMFAIALAVGMTPEMMPMIIAINLSKGSLAMSKRGVIVKQLSAIQNFGSMDVLCTDKTGTLTEDHIALVKYVDAYGNLSEETLRYGYLNSTYSNGFRNPLDEAIEQYRHISTKGYSKIAEIPFDFDRKRESVIVQQNKQGEIITKGAPEEVLSICTAYGTTHAKLTASIREAAEATYRKLSMGGYRVLAIAYRSIDSKASYGTDDEQDMVFMGLLAFMDPPKETVAKTVRRMKEHGITIKIITGDNELVSHRIAQEIGFHVSGVLLGSDIERLSDRELAKQAKAVNLFARVNPDQKLRIITILRANGHVVGYIGDGINDAPSLKAADVGISVNNATDIAKESADLIMMHKDLDDLVHAVIEGRKTFSNTYKYLLMTLSSNFGNMFSMAGASLFLPFLPMRPAQVLFNNLLYDTSQFTLPTDNVDEDELKHPQVLNLAMVKRFMVIFGPVSSAFDFLTFFILYGLLRLDEPRFQTGWFMESLATQVFVVYVIRTKFVPFMESRPSRSLVLGTLLVVTVGWAVALLPLGSYFGFVTLSGNTVALILLVVLMYLAIVEMVKQRVYRYLLTLA